MNADLRIPVTADQKRLIAEAVADAPTGLAASAREILVQAAAVRIAERQGGEVDDDSRSRRIRESCSKRCTDYRRARRFTRPVI